MSASAWVRGWLRTSIRYVAGIAGIGLLMGLAPATMAAEGTACVSDPQTIAYGSLTICDIEDVGDNDLYTFPVTVGQTVYVQVTRHNGGNPYFCLYLNGSLVACTPGTAYPAVSLTHKATASGTYSVRVAELGNDGTMTYALSLERIAPPSPNATLIKDADLVPGEINMVGDNDLFYFNVCGASTWYVQQTRLDGGNPYFCLYRPDGTSVACTPGTAYPAVSLTHAADQTGAYAIRAAELGNDGVMTYNLGLACLGGNCSQDCCPEGGCDQCFESGAGANYMKVCVSGDGTLEEFQSPVGYQQLAVADNLEGYALCSGIGASYKVHGYDAGLDEAGFGPATLIQPGGPGTFPLSIVRETSDGLFQVTQAYTRDTAEKDFTVTMAVKNLSPTVTASSVRLTRYFNGDIDNLGTDDLFDRTLDTVWGTQGPAGHGLGLYARSGIAHTLRIEDAILWDPQGGGGAETCVVAGVTPAGPDDYAGRLTYTLGTIAPGASKSAVFVYRRQ